MLIVIEGADRAGKTTLAKALAKVYHLRYQHFGPPGPDPMKEHAEFLLNLKEPTVCDRFFLGELVYSPLLRGREPDPLDVHTVCRLLRRMPAFIALAMPNLDEIEKRFMASGREHVTWSQNIQAYYEFQRVFTRAPFTNMRRMILRTETNDDLLDHLDTFMKVVEGLEDKAKEVEGFKGIGTVDVPALVLVGEALNPKKTRFGLPFDGGRSARFLDNSLVLGHVDESYVYLANADTITDQEVKHHYDLGSSFVALGEKASKKLGGLHMPHTMFPHPQFWARFHAKEADVYATKLEACYNKHRKESSHALDPIEYR